MLFRRLGAVAFGAAAVVALAAGAACSHSYAEEPSADASAVDSGAAADATDEATTDASAADADGAAKSFVELVTGRGALTGLAATEKYVYFTEATNSTVSTVPIEGGPVTTAFTAAGVPSALVAQGPLLFWADKSGVVRASVTDSSTSSRNTLAPQVGALAVVTDQLVVLSRTPPPALAAVEFFDLTLMPAGSVTLTGDAVDVAVSAAAVYWTETGGHVSTTNFGGVIGINLVSDEPGCEFIAANLSGAVWTRPNAGLVRFFAAPTATVGTLAALEKAPSSISGDGTDIYWLTGDGKVRRKTIGQELPPATVASGFPSAWAGTHVHALAVTSKYVVWITTDGRVLRTDK